jgi:hypothetical protein
MCMRIQYLNQERMSLGGLFFSFATQFRGAFGDDSTYTHDGPGTISMWASVEVHVHMDTPT